MPHERVSILTLFVMLIQSFVSPPSWGIFPMREQVSIHYQGFFFSISYYLFFVNVCANIFFVCTFQNNVYFTSYLFSTISYYYYFLAMTLFIVMFYPLKNAPK